MKPVPPDAVMLKADVKPIAEIHATTASCRARNGVTLVPHRSFCGVQKASEGAPAFEARSTTFQKVGRGQ